MPSQNKVEIIIGAKDQASQKINAIFGTLQKAGKAGAIGLGLVSAAAGLVTHELAGLARESATSINVQRAFQGIVENSGKSMDDMLKALERGSNGMVDQTTLMQTYNTAAQLVGTTFANQLPDAMGYLGKVSAATGQDMGYMLDSLVRGVGRLSPMILDNLGIQVDLVAANEAYAASIGKSVDELTKSEQQTALMNQVMEKMAENTASMPDIADSAAVKFAQFDAKLLNLKDTIGRAVLPFFEALLVPMTSVINLIEMMVTGDFKGGIFGLNEDSPAIIFFLSLRDAILSIASGGDVLNAIGGIITDVAEALQSYGNFELAAQLEGLYMIVVQIWRPVQAFIEQNVQLSDILLAVALVIGTFVVPAVWGMVAPFLVFIAIVAAVALAIAGLRKVWDEDIGGIRTFIQTQLLPALDQMRVWFVETAFPAIQQAIESIWNTVILPFFQYLADVWTTIQPALQSMFDWFVTTGLPAIGTIVNFVYNNVIRPVFLFIGEVWALVGPALLSLLDWFVTTGWPAISTIINFVYNNVIKPVFDFIALVWTLVQPALQSLYEWWTSGGWPVIRKFIEDVWHNVLEPLVLFFQGIWDAVSPALELLRSGIETVFNAIGGFINSVIEAIQRIPQTVTDAANAIANNPLFQALPGVGAGLQLITQGNAQGGIYTRPGIGVIGESLSGNQFEAVLNSDQIRELLAEARQGSTINNYFQGGPRTALEAQQMGYAIGNTLTAQGVVR